MKIYHTTKDPTIYVAFSLFILIFFFLTGIQNVNTASIVALVEQVSTARSNVNVESLRRMISQLQVSRSVQQTEIDRLTSLRDSLRVRVQRLLLLRGQITPM